MKVTRASLYQSFNLNLYGLRHIVLDKLENGIKGYEFKEKDKETDLRHIDILKNWRNKTKAERYSFIDDIDLTQFGEGFDLVAKKKVEVQTQIKETLKEKTKFLRGSKK